METSRGAAAATTWIVRWDESTRPRLRYWDGRSHAPDAATDARIYAAPVACETVSLGVPLSDAALRDVLRARAPREEKVAAMRRALDYFGVDQSAVPVPPRCWGAPARVVDGASAPPRHLARALRACFSWDAPT